ncbi:MAG: PQQ-dependent dehydrogenase, methanol/ethanol family, partial [Deltaproteobacteria bacterium]|nr:PQQ-dependent dehydrogenase, methanol/ethanol family [Deltaproteobacteria bacterium]
MRRYLRIRNAGLAIFSVMALLFTLDHGVVLAKDKTTSPSIRADRYVSADKEPENWLLNGRTYTDQRYSPLKQINLGNVSDLSLAWYADTDTTRGLEATPLVVDGIMYTSGSWSIVYALDARTGKILWEYDPEVPKAWGRNACCDVVNRGVAYWKGKVYVGTIDGRLVALNASTGAVLWDVNTIDRTKPYTITGAPRVANGRVFIGNGGAELGVRGYFSAYDANSGKMLWRFYTVPGNPKDGFENETVAMAAKTWTGEWWKMGGGGTVWNSMTYDPELNLLYVGVGNGSPWSRDIRSPEGGDNLFLSSIIAVRPDTGKLVWYYQTTPGETWDYTATQHIMLADMEIKGKMRKVLMQAPKNGFFYVLDRETGELLSAEKYVKVNWASHIDMKTGRPVENPEATWKDKTAIVSQSSLGGHNWQPMAYSPKTGLVYLPTRDVAGIYAKEPNFKYRPGGWNTGADLLLFSDVPPEAVTGYLLAWDPVQQKAAWKIKQSLGAWNGGILSTAGDMIFQGTNDGHLKAYRSDNGEMVWQTKTGTGIIAAPMTYMIDGVQYVSIMAGWGGVYGVAFGRAAKAVNGTGPGRILTYRLGGKAHLPPKDVTSAKGLPALIKPLPVSAEVVQRGQALYQRNCSMCHGFGMVGAGVLPDLRYSSPEVHEMWNDIVIGGALAGNGMASFA